MEGTDYRLWRQTLEDGAVTTLYAVVFPRATTRIRVLHFPPTRRLDEWAQETGREEAIVGGFFLRDPYRPLGEVWIDGQEIPNEPVASHAERRACVVAEGREVRFVAREDAPGRPAGDLLQAGPLLVSGGRVVFDRETDEEGFSSGSGQFDSDITDGRHPRAALGVSAESLMAVVCDGRRTLIDAGLTMPELARVMTGLDAEDAINLDGGGSTTLVHRAHLLNRPYSNQDQPAPATRPVVTALVFEPVV